MSTPAAGGAAEPEGIDDVPSVYGIVRYERDVGGSFDRVVFFTDAVYAIAMTLIVVSLGVPDLQRDPDSAAALGEALGDMAPEITAFFVTFLVIGLFWVANHRFTESLRAMDNRLVMIGLVYLSLVAFLPFPSSLMGEYDDNPLAVSVFAGCMAAISLLEWVQLRHARVAGLMRIEPSAESFRWLTLASLNPVVWFTASIAVAYAVGSTAAQLTWVLSVPTSILLGRLRPPDMAAA